MDFGLRAGGIGVMSHNSDYGNQVTEHYLVEM